MSRIDHSFSTSRPGHARSQLGFGLLVKVLAVFQARLVTRRALGRLDAHMLRDIGLDHLSARSEAAKPFWRD